MFISETGRVYAATRLPATDASRGEGVLYRGGWYAVNEGAGLWESSRQMPLFAYVLNHPVPLPLKELGTDNFKKELKNLGLRSSKEIAQAFRTKIISELVYNANTDLFARVETMFKLQVGTAVGIAGFGLWLLLKINDLQAAMGGGFP